MPANCLIEKEFHCWERDLLVREATFNHITIKQGPLMKLLFSYLNIAAVIAMTAFCASAGAAVVQYSDLAAFNAVTSGNIVESNSAPAGDYTPIGNSLINGITYPDYAYMVDPAYNNVIYAWGSGPVLLLSSSSTLTFAPTTAFGALFGTFQPYAADILVEINGSVHLIASADYPTLSFMEQRASLHRA